MSINISIIVPVYNVEPSLLRRCLDSIFSQSYLNYEVIAVDDGSTNETLAILNEYAKQYSNMLVKHFDKNEGLAINRRRGIELANYDYLIFVDGDDTINKDLVKELTLTLLKGDFDLIRYGVNIIGEPFWKDHERFNSSLTGIPMCGQEALKEWSKITDNKYALFWIYCFKKDLFSKKFTIPNVRYNEDFCSIPFLTLYSESVITIAYKGYNYTHQNPKSMTNNKELQYVHFKNQIFFDSYDFIVENLINFENLDYDSKIEFINSFKRSLNKKYKSFSDAEKDFFRKMYYDRVNRVF